MDKFDVVIVGAGPAGATAGYILAKAGLEVLIIDRGQYPGSKNVSGGLIFSQVYNQIFPNFWNEAPVERAIVGHSLMFLGKVGSTAIDYRGNEAAQTPYNAFSILRAKFDPWLASQAEAAGANIIPGYTVDELLVDHGRVSGIKAGEDEILADIVIVADGTRSGLLKKAKLREDFLPNDVSLGVKEVIHLPENTINERFQCKPGEGVAYTTVGQTAGVEGGGFLYTNRESLSIGVVAKIDSISKSGKQPHELLDEFKSHPTIARLITGGNALEYSAQTVHRGGLHLIPKLFGDGYLVVGSAAGLLLNNVMTLRGMDLAVASAAAAAQTVLDARQQEDFSANTLAVYRRYIQETSAYQDMLTFKNTYSLLENKRLFTVYPDLVCSVMEDMFTVRTDPGKKVYRSVRDNMSEQMSLMDMIKDLYQIGRGIVV